ncbi:MAG TPA: STN domain-containing protein, partial [Agriterribacter sp.]|nr:STN domain-containing protein [Agriterribacter sp.]
MKKNKPRRNCAGITAFIKLLVIMKLSFLLIILSFSHLEAKVYGQGNITLHLRETAISKAMHKIEKEGPFRFLYNYDLADLKKKVDIHVVNASLAEALGALFSNTNLTYRLLDNNLVVVLAGNSAHQPIRIT